MKDWFAVCAVALVIVVGSAAGLGGLVGFLLAFGIAWYLLLAREIGFAPARDKLGIKLLPPISRRSNWIWLEMLFEDADKLLKAAATALVIVALALMFRADIIFGAAALVAAFFVSEILRGNTTPPEPRRVRIPDASTRTLTHEPVAAPKPAAAPSDTKLAVAPPAAPVATKPAVVAPAAPVAAKPAVVVPAATVAAKPVVVALAAAVETKPAIATPAAPVEQKPAATTAAPDSPAKAERPRRKAVAMRNHRPLRRLAARGANRSGKRKQAKRPATPSLPSRKPDYPIATRRPVKPVRQRPALRRPPMRKPSMLLRRGARAGAATRR
jgi:hypothetical protein